MKLLVAAALLLAPAVAHAAPFVELGGGLALPVADDDYTDAVDPSLDLAFRIGSVGRSGLGGMFSVDWTPLSSNLDFVTFQRFRFMGHLMVQHPLAPRIQLGLRFGAGIDLLHESTEVDILGQHFEGSDSDVGLALEVAGGVWFAVGRGGGTHVGVELAVPISYHAKDGNQANPNDPDDPKVDYTGVDIDILAGVRLRL